MKYAVVIEQGPTSYGAHVPDLPGCVAAAETREEVYKLISEAIELYIEGLKEDRLPVPGPHSHEPGRGLESVATVAAAAGQAVAGLRGSCGWWYDFP